MGPLHRLCFMIGVILLRKSRDTVKKARKTATQGNCQKLGTMNRNPKEKKLHRAEFFSALNKTVAGFVRVELLALEWAESIQMHWHC